MSFIEDPGYRIDDDFIDELRACVLQGNLKRFKSDVVEIKRHPCITRPNTRTPAAAPDGIIRSSELPKIIPPLPVGDTKDLKVWKEYWKQHDEQIRQEARADVLDDLEAYCKERTQSCGIVKQLCYDAVLAKVRSLRHPEPGAGGWE